MTKKKYGNDLDIPLPPLPPSLKEWDFFLGVNEAYQAAVGDRMISEFEKLMLLMEHYELQTNNFEGLALALAREHVPGFKEAKPTGRKKKWDVMALGCVYVEVEREKVLRDVHHDQQDPQIFFDIAHREPWASFLSRTEGIGISSDPPEAIRRAYFNAKKDKAAQVFWTLYMFFLNEHDLKTWLKFVANIISKRSPMK